MQDFQNSYYLSYEEFLLKKHSILLNADQVESITVYNSHNLFYPPLTEESELPWEGVFFDDIDYFKNLSQLYLDGVFLKEMPVFFTSFKKLERLQIQHVVGVITAPIA